MPSCIDMKRVDQLMMHAAALLSAGFLFGAAGAAAWLLNYFLLPFTAVGVVVLTFAAIAALCLKGLLVWIVVAHVVDCVDKAASPRRPAAGSIRLRVVVRAGDEAERKGGSQRR